MPPLLALPGTLLDGRSLLPALAGTGARIELLGDCAALDDELARLASLVDRPAIWLGHSLGGIVAMHLAMAQPRAVAGLVVLGANARPGRDTSSTRRAAQWHVAQARGLRALAMDKLAPVYEQDADAALLDSLADQAEAVGMRRFEHQLGYAAERPGLLEPRRELAVPLLALSAEHDSLCPPSDGADVAALSRYGVHRSLAGAGHLFPMQQPASVAAALQRFLSTLEPAPA